MRVRVVMICLALAWILWVGFAVMVARHNQATVDTIYVLEPETRPGVLPANAQAAPQMLFVPCPLSPQNVPIITPERKA